MLYTHTYVYTYIYIYRFSVCGFLVCELTVPVSSNKPTLHSSTM